MVHWISGGFIDHGKAGGQFPLNLERKYIFNVIDELLPVQYLIPLTSLPPAVPSLYTTKAEPKGKFQRLIPGLIFSDILPPAFLIC